MSYFRRVKKINKRKLKLDRQRRRFSRFATYVTSTLMLIILGLGCYLLFVKYRVFEIRNVEIEGTKTFVNEIDMLELAKSRSYGNNLLTFGTNELKESLLESFQGAKDLYVSKRLPRTVKVKVVERTPLAIIHDEQRENFYLVDEDGYVLGQVESGTTNFPEIFYAGEIEVGYFLDKETVSIYFGLLHALDSEKLLASSMSVHSDYVSMYVGGNVEVLVGKDKDISKVTSLLSVLLRQLATEGKDVKRVDLRYDKVIVSYR